jgi:hypothetical protein
MQKRGAHDLGVLPLQNFDRTLLLMFRRPPDNAPIGPPALQEAVRDRIRERDRHQGAPRSDPDEPQKS